MFGKILSILKLGFMGVHTSNLFNTNIFIGSLIFVEELDQKVKAAVETEREILDVVLVFPSMP